MLQTLGLGKNGVTKKGMAKFAPRVGCMTALRYLTLSDNPIGDEGTLTLVPYLQDMRHIEIVSLLNCNVTDEGLIKMRKFRVGNIFRM